MEGKKELKGDNTKKIKEDAITQVAGDPRRFIADASDLGLAPGEWPQYIEVENVQLKKVGADGPSWDGSVRYHSSMFGISLLVVND